MTAAGMWPENSGARLSLSQSPSYHVQERRKGSRAGQQRAAAAEGAVDGSLGFLHMNSLRVAVLCISQAFSTIITIRVEADQTLLLHEFCWLSSGSSVPDAEIMTL